MRRWVFLVMLLGALGAGAQGVRPRADWGAVEGLKPGRPLLVSTGNGLVKCGFVAAGPESLTCHAEGGPVLWGSVAGSEVRLGRMEVISVRPRGRHVRRVLAVVGAGAGLVLGRATGDGVVAVPLALSLSFFGYLTGVLIDNLADLWPRAPVYVAP